MNPTEKVHVVVILGRVHGCETPSSYVCQGKSFIVVRINTRPIKSINIMRQELLNF